MTQNGQQSEVISSEKLKKFFGELSEFRNILRDAREELGRVLPTNHGGELSEEPEDPESYVSQVLTTVRNQTAQVTQKAEEVHHAHVGLAPGLIDPVEIVEQHVPKDYQDEYARGIWDDHVDCTADELEAIKNKLDEIIESLRPNLAEYTKAGEDPPEDLMQGFLDAYYRRPIVDYMLERIALDGPTAPSWESIRWQEQIRLQLRGNDASYDALRVLYALLVQRERQFDNVSDAYFAAGELLGKGRSAIVRNLKSAVGKEKKEMKRWTGLPDDLEDLNRWLKDHPGLAVDM